MKKTEIENQLASLGVRMESSLSSLDDSGHAIVSLSTGEVLDDDELTPEIIALAEQWSALQGPLSGPQIRQVALAMMRSDNPSELAKEVLPGACAEEILSVNMLDLVGEYESPDKVPEWAWVACNASFAHVQNGKPGGVWEFILNLSHDFSDAPANVKAVIDRARSLHASYLIFHQGT